MSFAKKRYRSGVSLMEVLISIGVIALGIFGVASLIPLAQYRVAQGTTADRQSAMGQSAVAEFRVRNMNNPDNWWYPPALVTEIYKPGPTGQEQAAKRLRRRGYCLDPLGGLVNADGSFTAAMRVFPAGVSAMGPEQLLAMPRITLSNGLPGTAAGPMHVEVADDIFSLRDELEFDRPDQDELQPNLQYFIDGNGQPIKAVSAASLSWFATITPTEAVSSTTDKFILSVVLVKDRVRNALAVSQDEGFAAVTSPYSGEVILKDSPGSMDPNQYRVADLRQGDWLLLVKFLQPITNTSDNMAVYRWTKIIGADDKGGEESNPNDARSFSIANDDFFSPDESASLPRYAIFVRGVKGVVERTVRLENSTAWD